jgi:hypothetical protein
MADQLNTTVIKIEPDSSNRRADQSIKSISDRLGDQRTVVKRLSDETRKLERAFRRGTDVSKEWARAEAQLVREKTKQVAIEKDLRRAIDGTNREIEERNRRQREQAGIYGDVGSRTRDITGLIGAAGGDIGARIERSVNIGAEFLDANEGIRLMRQELPKLASQTGLANLSVGQLAGGIGVATLAVVGVTAAMYAMKDASDESRQAALARIETLRKLSELEISTLTTSEIKEQQAAIEETNKIRRAEREELARERDELNFNLAAHEQLAEAVGIASFGVDDYDNRIKELDKEINASIGVYDKLESALSDATTAANDAIAAEEKLADRRKTRGENLIELARDELDAAVQARNRAKTWTREQLDARQSAIDDQLAIEKRYRERLNDLFESGEITSEQFESALNNSYSATADLERELRLLYSVVSWGIELRAREAAAIAGVNTSIEALNKASNKLQEDLIAGASGILSSSRDTAALVGGIADVNNTIDQERIKFEEAQAKATIKQYQELAKIDRDYLQDRGDVLRGINADIAGIDQERIEEIRDFNKESIRLAEDHQDALLKIERDLNTGIESAVEDRNVGAAIAAARAAEEQAQDENKRYETDKERREEDFNDLLKQIAAERSERMRAGQQELIDLRNRHNAERAERINAFQAQLNIARHEHNMKVQMQQSEIAALQAHQSRMFSLTQAFHAAAEQSLAGRLSGLTRTVAPSAYNDALASPKTLTPSSSLSVSMPVSFGGTPTGTGEIMQVLENVFMPRLTDALRRASG